MMHRRKETNFIIDENETRPIQEQPNRKSKMLGRCYPVEAFSVASQIMGDNHVHSPAWRTLWSLQKKRDWTDISA